MSCLEDLFEEGELHENIPNLVRAELGLDRDEVYIRAFVSERSPIDEYKGYDVEQIIEKDSSSSSSDSSPSSSDSEDEVVHRSIVEPVESIHKYEESLCTKYKIVGLIGVNIMFFLSGLATSYFLR